MTVKIIQMPSRCDCSDFVWSRTGFAALLGSVAWMGDDEHGACPEEWRSASALLQALIEDDRMTTPMVACPMPVPVAFVAEYRRVACV